MRLAYVVVAVTCAQSAVAQRFITVASTTSTEQSGLFRHLLPMFEQKTGLMQLLDMSSKAGGVQIFSVGDRDPPADQHSQIDEGVRMAKFGKMNSVVMPVRPSSESTSTVSWLSDFGAM